MSFLQGYSASFAKPCIGVCRWFMALGGVALLSEHP
jgi:hypothetical protein